MAASRGLCGAAVLCAAALLLGCSNGPSDEDTYRFAQDPLGAMSGTVVGTHVRAEVPERLLTVLRQRGGTPMVTGLTVAARELEDSDFCAADVTLEYAEGAVEKLTRPSLSDALAHTLAEVEQQRFLEEIGAGDELQKFLDDPGDPAAEGFWAGIESDYHVSFASHDLTAAEFIEAAESSIDENWAEQVRAAAATPRVARIAGRLDLPRPAMIDALDAADPEKGSYFSLDFREVTLVTACASSTQDFDASMTLPIWDAEIEDAVRFATASIAVMASGDLGIWGEVAGYSQNTDGDWIAK